MDSPTAKPGRSGTTHPVNRPPTYCQVDPKERLVAVALTQHFPFNEHGFFNSWATAYYQALK
jgi:hypothetical protein